MALDGINNLIQSLTAFDTKTEVHTILQDNADSIVDFQHTQMYEGRAKDGGYIRPFYSEDPFFKTPEQAYGYALWKSRITPNPLRPFDVPNLFINGYFYTSLVAVIGDDTYSIESDNNLGEKIFEEHPNAEGLSPKNSEEFSITITIPEFARVFEQRTGLILSL